MEIRHRNAKLRKICECESAAQRELGKDGAKKLGSRINDLKAARSVSELPVGTPHPLKGDRKGQFSLHLNVGNRLVFSPDHGDQVPKCADGSIDWNNVTDIRIEEIEDYHRG